MVGQVGVANALTSFFCPCGAPLAAVVGTPSVACHVCGTVVGVPALPPPPPPPPPTAPAPAVIVAPGPRLFAAFAAIASAALFVAYLAVGLQILGLFGRVALVVRDLGGIVTIAGVVGILIAVAGIYESVRAFRCGVVALIVCGVFHVLAGLVLLSMNDRSGLGELIVAMLGGPLGSVHTIGVAALVIASACIAAGIAVRQARSTARRAPPPSVQTDAPLTAAVLPPKPSRRWLWIAGGVGAVATMAIAFGVTRKSGATAPAMVLVDEVAYGYEGGCRTNQRGADPCGEGSWSPVTYMRGGTELFDRPCWSVCPPGEHARKIDMTGVVMGSIRCVAGTHYPRGLGSCAVTFQRSVPKSQVEAMEESYEESYEESSEGHHDDGDDKGADEMKYEMKYEIKEGSAAGSVLGGWSGNGSQDGRSPYPVELDITGVDGQCGRFSLPSLGCSGELTCVNHDGDHSVFTRMTVTQGVGNCVAGNIALGVSPDGTASYRWTSIPSGQYADGIGTLSRVR